VIIVYEGVPGSGKTYEAVRKIVDNLRLGRVVYTNIEGMDDERCHEAIKAVAGLSDYEFAERFHFLSGEDVKRFWQIVKPGSLIVLDEVHKWFNSRDWQKEGNRDFSDWASTHRHYGFDLVLISQRIEKIDAQARTLAEWTYRFKKINFLGSLVKKGYVAFAYSGDDTKEYLSKQIRRYDKKIFACYQSYVTKDTKELGVQKVANVLRHPVFYAIPLVFVLTIFFAMRSGLATGDFFGSKKALARADEMKKSPPSVYTMPFVTSSKVENVKPKPEPSGDVKRPGGSGINDVRSNDVGKTERLEGNEKKVLVGVVDGKKVFRCGVELCP